MPTNHETLLCRYHYDPLDRLAACTLSKQASIQRFYLKSRLATEIQDQVHRSIFQHEDQLLAQQQRQGGTVETTLLATDQQRSVLNALDTKQPHPLAYTPYGHRPLEGGLLSLLGFNGERPDPVTGHYLLGNGYRAFNPVLMRFNSPDSWSPFGEGGLNAYAYCLGDPVNLEDRTGHAPGFFSSIMKLLGRSPNNGFNRLAANTRTSISSTFSASSLPAAITATPDAPVGMLIPGLSSRSSNSSIVPNPTMNARSLLEDAPGAFNVQNTLVDARSAMATAETKMYSGRKLNSLKQATKKLEKHHNNRDNLLRKYEIRQENLHEYGLIDSNNSPTPEQLARHKIYQQRNKVIQMTDTLNKKLRSL